MAHDVLLTHDYFKLTYYPSTDEYGYEITKGSSKWKKYTHFKDEGEAFSEACKVVDPDVAKDLSTEYVDVHLDPDNGTYKVTSKATGEVMANSSMSAAEVKQALPTYDKVAKFKSEYEVFKDAYGDYQVKMKTTGEVFDTATSDIEEAIQFTGFHEEELVKAAEKKAKTVVETIDKGTYYLSRTEDGKWAYTVKSTGAYKTGYGDKGAASSAGKTAVKKESKSVLAQKGISDAGHDQTERLLSVYEKRAAKAYQQAAEEMASKQAAFMERYGKELAERRTLLEAGEMTEKEFKAWLQEQNLAKDWYRGMVDTLSHDMVNVDKAAMAMLNNELPEMYALNMNYGTFQIEATTGISTGFNMYDRSTVMKLIKDGNAPLLPQAGIDASKDLHWNRRKLNSAVTQGILQGESIPDIAKRLTSVVQMDYNGAIRSARTMTTAAQNAGRLESYRRAESMGISTKKRWLATMDRRTRSSHVAIDLETVDLEKRFSNRCMYPGDPTGPGFEVYNCRCTMIPVVDGHEYDMSGRPNKLGKSWQQWQDENKALQASRAAQAASRQAAAAAAMPSNSVPWQEYESRMEDQWRNGGADTIRDMGREQVKKFDDEEGRMVRRYTGGAYEDMNNFKRGRITASEASRRSMEAIPYVDSAMEKSVFDEELFLFRGCGSSKRAMYDLFDQLKASGITESMVEKDPSHLVGMTYRDLGYLSTTIKPGGVGFGKKVSLVIHSAPGSKGIYLDSISNFEGTEHEFLFRAGQNFIIQHAEYDSYYDNWKLWVETAID